MRKRFILGLATGALAAAMLSGAVSAAPNPDSAAGTCGGVTATNPGIGDSQQQSMSNIKAAAEFFGINIGAARKALSNPGMSLPLACAPGDPQPADW